MLGWTKHKDIEYWIIKDTNTKFLECYYPLSKITDKYWFGIEFSPWFNISVELSEELKNRIENENENENTADDLSGILSREDSIHFVYEM